MARIKYYYDTEKCRYERLEVKSKDVLLSVFGFLSLAFLLAIGLTFLYYQYFPSPQQKLLESQHNILSNRYITLEKELNKLDKQVIALEEQDKQVYRTIFEISPPNKDSFNLEKIDYGNITDIASARSLIQNKLNKINKLRNKIAYQNASYKELLNVAKDKEKFFSNQPAIQPVENKNLKRLASGFGYRMHPILRVRRFHKGIDFSAPRGTPIYATGGGKIYKIENKKSGYGKNIIIDHGYGYKTRYAHMQKMDVKVGQTVKRGDQIGTVGNTGSSTGPHVHYEVYKDGKVVNPVYYFFNDLSEEEYEEILRQSTLENQSMS